MHLLGLDIGSSSIKASIIDAESGSTSASVFYPDKEMPISVPEPGFAEQDPGMWWKYSCHAIKKVIGKSGIKAEDIRAIGISYQMHGLVMVDKNLEVVSPSIIWCDSRATGIGNKALRDIGEDKCLGHLLNSPGNFTASKLAWVKENQPRLFDSIYKMMLPGDYIAMKLTGEVRTTVSGLSEGILWDFKNNDIADFILDYYGIDRSVIPEAVPTFGEQGTVTGKASGETGLPEGIPVAYRAGDQPNNAFSLNVLKPGELAAVAGTSGVVYGVSDRMVYDPQSRINIFAHVNHSAKKPGLGVLLCINGAGILNSWIRRNISVDMTYEQIDCMAASVKVGADGLIIIPFGNGAERMLDNTNYGAGVYNLDFNIHSREHILRAAHEGLAFAFRYGIELMNNMGIGSEVIRAGYGNMFLSPVFRQTLSNITGAVLELYNTDGANGAALAAGLGAGIFKNEDEAFRDLSVIKRTEPELEYAGQYSMAYDNWLNELNRYINNN